MLGATRRSNILLMNSAVKTELPPTPNDQQQMISIEKALEYDLSEQSIDGRNFVYATLPNVYDIVTV